MSNWQRFDVEDLEVYELLSRSEVHPRPRQIVSDHVHLPNGYRFHYVYRPKGGRAVFILPITPEGKVLLIRQYRYPIRQYITEIPAGAVEPQEDILHAAQRELLEEVGGTARELIPLPAFYPQVAFSGAVFYPVLALGVEVVPNTPEITEDITVVPTPLTEVYAALGQGEILEGASSLVLYAARHILQSRGLL